MQILENHSLKPYNTFGIDAKAKWFVSVSSTEELIEVLKSNPDCPKLILGGGSNMLLTKDQDAMVIHINLKGKSIIRTEDNFSWIEAYAGENWHELVLWSIDNNLGGIENMSLIPGNAGTTPVQNIGAYGVEIKDTLDYCEALNIKTLEIERFYNQDCKFGYRESIFKSDKKGQYIILKVVFKLTNSNHKIHIDYGDIKAELEQKNISLPSIKDVSNAVIAIRQRKLPDPKELGNSGSFFKNPVISREDFEKVQSKFPEIKFFNVSETQVKVPAGWLIEQSGFKGKQFGDAGVHKNQALVLVNHGNATGNEIWDLAQNIQKTILDTYGIAIEAEVNIL